MYCKKRFVLLFVYLCVSISFLFALDESKYEINRQKVKIGFLGYSNYFSLDEINEISLYGKKYLSIISNSSNLDFEFVTINSIDEMYESLNNGEIDVFFGGLKNPKYEDSYIYSENPLDYFSEIIVSSVTSKHINYEDFTAIDNSKIGYIKNQICLDLLKKYIDEHNLTVELIGFDSVSELKEALHSERITVAYGNSYSFANEGKIIDVLGYFSTYMIFNVNNYVLKKELDKASVLFNLYYNDKLNLIDVNFQEIKLLPAFTKKEQELIFKHPKINVLVDKNNYPFEYFSDKKFTGVTSDILDLISSKTSIYFNYITEEQFQTGEYENVIKINYTEYGIDRTNFDIIPIYLTLNYSKINLIGQNEYKTVGLKNTLEMKDFAQYLKIDEDNIIYYDDYVDCYDAVKNRKVDYSIVPKEIGKIFLNYPRYYMIEKNSPCSWIRNINLGYSKDFNPTLKRIINKSITIINSQNIEHYISDEIKNHKLDFTLIDFIHEHLEFSLLILIVFLILFSILIILFVIRHNSKKEMSYIKECSIAKTNFLSKVSHDVRTPLNGIIGLIDLSLEEKDCEKIKGNLHKIKIHGDFILELINQTLDLNKIENHKLELEIKLNDLNHFYNELNEVFSYSVQIKKINFVFEKHFEDKLYWAYFDKLRLNQIYMNILSNSIKFTKENGFITVYVKVDEIGDEYVVRSYVKDTGSGMSQEFQRKMYNDYEQEKGSNNSKGSGLGLAITKSLVDLMGGSIICESEIDKGTIFYLNFKFKKGIHKKTQANKNKFSVGKNEKLKNALIADDSEINLKILKTYLEKFGMNVVLAENGKQAVDIFENSEGNYFDIILIDIYMPIMDGLTASKKIRDMNRKDSKTVHIVVLTGDVFDKKVDNLKPNVVNEVLLKPLNFEKLKEIIEKI